MNEPKRTVVIVGENLAMRMEPRLPVGEHVVVVDRVQLQTPAVPPLPFKLDELPFPLLEADYTQLEVRQLAVVRKPFPTRYRYKTILAIAAVLRGAR